jgi:sensor histidine kinase YesM
MKTKMMNKKTKRAFGFAYGLLLSAILTILEQLIEDSNVPQYRILMFGISIFLLVLINGGFGYIVLRNQGTKHKSIASFLFFVLLNFIGSLFVLFILVYIFLAIKGLTYSDLFTHFSYIKLTIVEASQFLIWTLLTSTAFFFIFWRIKLEVEQNLREESLKFKYQNLKSQMNSHFLFNTLNTLSELVYIDAKKSDKFIQDLSAIYRYIIENEEVDLIGLDTEISFVKQYFNLQQTRDGEKIKLQIDIINMDKIKIVPVSVQILVENALKHNAKSEDKPLIIKIKEENEEIIVSNNIQKKSVLENSTKTGLPNLKKRTKIITGKEIIINEKNNIFIVKLPTLK